MSVSSLSPSSPNLLSTFSDFVIILKPVPEEFNYDPVSKTYGEPQRRPEIQSATIEFIAPSEYMVSITQFSMISFHSNSPLKSLNLFSCS